MGKRLGDVARRERIVALIADENFRQLQDEGVVFENEDRCDEDTFRGRFRLCGRSASFTRVSPQTILGP